MVCTDIRIRERALSGSRGLQIVQYIFGEVTCVLVGKAMDSGWQSMR